MEQVFQNGAMNEYFATLSPLVQQSILQSGVAPKTLAQLQQLASKMSDAHPTAK